MSLHAPLVDPLDVEQPDPRPSDAKSSWDRLFWLISFALSLLGVAMALISVFTEISTIYAYYSNGDRGWGVIAPISTLLGWAFFTFLGLGIMVDEGTFEKVVLASPLIC